MSYIFKSSGLHQSYNFMWEIRTYTFLDFINKNDLIFAKNEIENIYAPSWKKNHYAVTYRKNNTSTGCFACNELPENFPTNQVIVKNRFDYYALPAKTNFDLKSIILITIGLPSTIFFAVTYAIASALSFYKIQFRPEL